MKCPNCANPKTRVVFVRQKVIGTALRAQRRRKCPRCGWRLTTDERILRVDPPKTGPERRGRRKQAAAET